MSILLETINEIRERSGREALARLHPEMKLREDLEMDSFALAELTVHLEVKTGIDIFKDGLLTTVGDLEYVLTHSAPTS